MLQTTGVGNLCAAGESVVTVYQSMCATAPYVLLVLSLSSPLCRVFTIMYLKQTVLLGYIVLQLFCIYSSRYMYCYFAR